ncbi:MAG: NADH:flavin oxidoreductase [Polyangiaceae bacterium]
MTDLLAPISFKNGAVARNRVALAAMTNLQSHTDGTLSNEELTWLVRRARGGFGIVTTCASHVAKDGQGWPGELGIFDDSLIPGLTRLASALHEHGALSLVQIFHGGLRADASQTQERPWSANEVEGGCRAGTEADLERVIRQFGDAAERAHKAGFDGVEIHGAHGYLLGQFLSAIDNTRQDKWGGTIENRARLIREVTRSVRSRVPSSFVVGVRISPEDFGQARGLDLDESLQVGQWLCEDGIDFLHLSLWKSHSNTAKRPNEHALQAFKKVIPADVKLFVAGSLWTAADAQQMFDLGADVVALGRAGITNPEWPQRITQAGWEPKRPPISAEELLECDLSPGFVEYMRRWKGFVSP